MTKIGDSLLFRKKKLSLFFYELFRLRKLFFAQKNLKSIEELN